jgi:hypothetical protein
VVVAYLKPQAFTRHMVNPLVSRLQTGGVAVVACGHGRPMTGAQAAASLASFSDCLS